MGKMLDVSALKAVFFDAGNTLIHINYPVIAEIFSGLGFSAPAEQIFAAEVRARVRIDRVVALGQSTEDKNTFQTFMRLFMEEISAPGELLPSFINSVTEYNRAENLWNRPDPNASEVLGALKRAGFKTGVISNSDGTVTGILEKHGLARDLDFIIDSSVVGIEKPDPGIFRLGLKAAGVDPSEALYIGDLYSIDVLGARSAGMQGVLIDPIGAWPPLDCLVVKDVGDFYNRVSEC